MARAPISAQLLQVGTTRTARLQGTMLAPSLSAKLDLVPSAKISAMSQGYLAKAAIGSRMLAPPGPSRAGALFRPLPRYLDYPQRPERRAWKAPRLPEGQPREALGIPPAVPPLGRELGSLFGPNFGDLRRLDVGPDVSDALLIEIANVGLPSLQALLCRRSAQLSDQGVLSLAGGMSDRPWDTQAAAAYLKGDLQAPGAPPPCPQLREIDITFCPGTTYLMTLALRRLLPTLACIRRMPFWMTGENETPFDGKGKPKEIHKYWADGSFRFSRSAPGESKGFVHRLQERADGVVCEALQYIDYTSEGSWPSFAEYCYRPGIAVKRADGRSEEDGFPTGLFVWEACDGIRAPAAFFARPDGQAIPRREMIVVRRDGSKVLGADPDAEHPGCLVLSHMAARPLPEGREMPPQEVLEENGRYLLRHQDPSLDEPAAESLIHRELGGNAIDDAVWMRG